MNAITTYLNSDIDVVFHIIIPTSYNRIVQICYLWKTIYNLNNLLTKDLRNITRVWLKQF